MNLTPKDTRSLLRAAPKRPASRWLAVTGDHAKRLGALLTCAALMLTVPLPTARAAPPPPSTAAAAAPATDEASPPVGGIHYQALAGADAAPALEAAPLEAIAIFLPRPPLESWAAVEVTAAQGCLELGALSDPGPGYVLVQAATVSGPEGDGLAPGQSCASSLRASFRDQQSTWDAVVAVGVHRPANAPYPDDDLSATFTFSRIEPAASDPRAPQLRALLLEVTLTNHGQEPLELVGIADPDGVAAARGTVYRLPIDAYVGTVRELEAFGGDTTDLPLPPGESVRLGLLLDPEADLARIGGVLSVQPSLIVRRGDDTYSLRLDRVSTSWGDELP